MIMKNYKYHYEESARLRQQFWEGIGKVHEDVVVPMINPAFMSGVAWPSLSQSFIKVDTAEGTIIATEGLSDPYDDFDANPQRQAFNGIGCELYIECDEILKDFDKVKDSWQFSILYQAAQLAAGNPDMYNMMEQYGRISTELYHCSVPTKYISRNQRTGVLLGLHSQTVPTHVALSLESVRMVNVKLLSLKELKYINKKGGKARDRVAELILKQEKASKSFLNRKSVINAFTYYL